MFSIDKYYAKNVAENSLTDERKQAFLKRSTANGLCFDHININSDILHFSLVSSVPAAVGVISVKDPFAPAIVNTEFKFPDDSPEANTITII